MQHHNDPRSDPKGKGKAVINVICRGGARLKRCVKDAYSFAPAGRSYEITFTNEETVLVLVHATYRRSISDHSGDCLV